jgi:hypothetical protein
MVRDSVTETYVALRLEVENWRWDGVPPSSPGGQRASGTPEVRVIQAPTSPRLPAVAPRLWWSRCKRSPELASVTKPVVVLLDVHETHGAPGIRDAELEVGLGEALRRLG